MSHQFAEIGDVVASGVTDAWAATSALAQELAATAANAVEVVHPKPQRRFNPWLLVAAGLAAALTAGWWMRRQRSTTPETAPTYVSPATTSTPTPSAAATA